MSLTDKEIMDGVLAEFSNLAAIRVNQIMKKR